MNRLISRACLGLEQEELQAKEAKTPGEDQTVVMNGSLGAIYTKALNIAYAKADPLTGTPSLETQALDYYKAAQIKTSGDKSTKPTDNVIDVVNNGTTLKTDSSVDETIEVIKELKGTTVPSEFIFIDKATSPTDDSPLGGASMTMVEIGRTQPISMEDVESVSIVVKLKNKPQQ